MQIVLVLFLIAVATGLALIAWPHARANSEPVSHTESGFQPIVQVPLSPIGKYRRRSKQFELIAASCWSIGVIAMCLPSWFCLIAFAVGFLVFSCDPMKPWRGHRFWDGMRFLALVVAWPSLLIIGFGHVDRDFPAKIDFFPIADVAIGFLFAFAFFVRHMPCERQAIAITKLSFGAIATWICVSLPLLGAYEFITKPHWADTQRINSYYRAMRVQIALHDYAKDCGDFPTQEQGLMALAVDREKKGWRGPYVDELSLVDCWGNPLRFRVHEKFAEVWSIGKDGVDGTADDLRYPGNERRN